MYKKGVGCRRKLYRKDVHRRCKRNVYKEDLYVRCTRKVYSIWNMYTKKKIQKSFIVVPANLFSVIVLQCCTALLSLSSVYTEKTLSYVVG
jgi:hypothetical protein